MFSECKGEREKALNKTRHKTKLNFRNPEPHERLKKKMIKENEMQFYPITFFNLDV